MYGWVRPTLVEGGFSKSLKKELQRAHLNFASSLDFEDETGMKRSRSPLQDQISFLAGGLGGGVGEKDKRNQLGPTNTPVTVSSKSN